MTHEKSKFHGFHTALRLWVVHLRLIPGVSVIACVDDQNVARLDYGFAGDHFRGNNAVIRDQVRNVDNHAGAAQILQRDVGDGTAAGVKRPFPDQVRPYRVAPVQNLAVGALPSAVGSGDAFEKMDL
jgi:hypothetical protein